MRPTAIETMRTELKRIQATQAECLTDHGSVKGHCRYRYQILVQKAKEFKNSIEWLESQVYATN